MSLNIKIKLALAQRFKIYFLRVSSFHNCEALNSILGWSQEANGLTKKKTS